LLTALAGIAGVALEWRRTEDQRRRAEKNFLMARRAVDDYLTTVSQNTLLKSHLPGLQPLRKQLLEKALQYYQEFLRERAEDRGQKAATAAAFYRVGDITGAIGSKPAALDSLGRARTLFEQLSHAAGRHPAYRFGLARCYRRTADMQSAIGSPVEAGES